MSSSFSQNNGRLKTYGKKIKGIARQRNVGIKGSIDLWDESKDAKLTTPHKELNTSNKDAKSPYIPIFEDEDLNISTKTEPEYYNESTEYVPKIEIQISKPVAGQKKEHRRPLGPRPMNVQSNKKTTNGARQNNHDLEHENENFKATTPPSPSRYTDADEQQPPMNEVTKNSQVFVEIRPSSPSTRTKAQGMGTNSSCSSTKSSNTQLDITSVDSLVYDTYSSSAKQPSEINSFSPNDGVDILTSIIDKLCFDIAPNHATDEATTGVASVTDIVKELPSDTVALVSSVEEDLATLRIAQPDATPLEILLGLCEQQNPSIFSEHISGLFDKLYHLRKIGEASYSEVFEQYQPGVKGSTVLKIIPFGGEEDCAIEDIIQELKITKTLSNLEGFIGFRGAHVVQGLYASELLDIWDNFDSIHTSENLRPDVYNESQLYCVIGLEHGGVTLENIVLESWSQAAEIFQQVAKTLARGEIKHEFEHRDLHCGNLVISFDQVFDPDCSRDASAKNRLLPANASFTVKLIDFTLSRAKLGQKKDDIVFLDLVDQSLFTAEGDYQFDMYRFMRNEARSGSKQMNKSKAQDNIDWSIYRPQTNVLWLHYLARRLLLQCGLTKPALRGKRKGSEQEITFYQKMVKIEKAIDPKSRNTSEKGKTIKSAIHKCAADVAEEFGTLI